MYRVFLSHSRRDNAAALALFRWLTDNEPSLRGRIFLDVDSETGFAPGVRWKSELSRAVDHCEAVVCLISRHWENSGECIAEARLGESLHKRLFCARIDPDAQGERVREWQICDLFPDGDGRVTTIASDTGEPVELATDGLERLLRGLHDAGIGAEYFPWPPEGDSERAPYRGWQSMEDVDAAVFFGRDSQILRGMDALRGMRATAVEGLFVILGPSGGHHRPGNRRALASRRALGRAPTGQSRADRRDGRQTAAGQGRARGRHSRRGRAGKPAAAMERAGALARRARPGSERGRRPRPGGRRMGIAPTWPGMAVRGRAPGRGGATGRIPHVLRAGTARGRIPPRLARARGRQSRCRARASGGGTAQRTAAP